MQIVAMMNLTSSPSSGLSWKVRLGPSPAGGGPGFLQRVATGQQRKFAGAKMSAVSCRSSAAVGLGGKRRK